jgi:putative sterol carrier protein
MPIFASDEQLYVCTEVLFDRIQTEYPSAARAFAGSRLVVRLKTSEPEAEIFVNGRQNPLKTSFGPSADRADLDIELTADTLHLILMGDLPLGKALGSGSLRVRGPVFRALSLAELFQRGQSIYPEILQQQGIQP